MNMSISYIGKVVFSLGLIVFGVLHFMNASMLAGLVPSVMPGGVIWVYITGLSFLAAAAAILSGKEVRLAATLLACELAIFVLAIHLPAVLSGNMMSLGNLLKDSMLAGAALVIAGTAPRKG